MWWNVGKHLKNNVSRERGPTVAKTGARLSNLEAHKDSKNLKGFLHAMRTKFGTLTRAWRHGIDLDDSGQVTFREFCEALKHIGYVGNLKTLWYQLDDDASGHISLAEIDPEASAALEKFRVLCITQHGTMERAWKQVIDLDGSGCVSMPEFVAGAKRLGYESSNEVQQLFHHLDTGYGGDSITLKDVDFLQNWEHTKVENQMQKRLGRRWVNKDPYFQAAHDFTSVCPHSPAYTSEASGILGAVQVVEAVPKEYSEITGYDPQETWDNFLTFLRRRFGSLPVAFDHMDTNATGVLSLVEFQSVVCGTFQYCRASEAKRLFLSAVGDDQSFTWQDLGITPQEWVMHLLEIRQRQKKLENATAMGKAGHVARARMAEKKHTKRVQDPEPQRMLSFGMRLPSGWGFPPNFDPRNARTL